ncbi:MAG: glucose-6-phosphate isomerase, partial [Pseudomonadota bacterium]
MTSVDELPSWAGVRAVAEALATTPMRKMFAADPSRAARYSIEAAGLFLDYSKNKIDDAARDALLALAEAVDLEGARRAMFAGEKINTTENRAVLHAALRDFSLHSYFVDGEDVRRLVETEREKLKRFVEDIHGGARRGRTGAVLDTVVNIGIGGSDLGPHMVC